MGSAGRRPSSSMREALQKLMRLHFAMPLSMTASYRCYSVAERQWLATALWPRASMKCLSSYAIDFCRCRRRARAALSGDRLRVSIDDISSPDAHHVSPKTSIYVLWRGRATTRCKAWSASFFDEPVMPTMTPFPAVQPSPDVNNVSDAGMIKPQNVVLRVERKYSLHECISGACARLNAWKEYGHYFSAACRRTSSGHVCMS